MMTRVSLLAFAALTLASACSGGFPDFGLKKRQPQPAAAVQNGAGQMRPPARPGEGEAEDAEAASITPPPSTPALPTAGPLGTTIASLGNAAEPGMWIKTPLTQTKGPGTVSYNGKTVNVELIPLEGPVSGGSRISLQAMQAIGAALTDLPEVTVSR
ncbi:hypothetical protein ACRARG_16885 [Pseudooceanicola sp. C21-150M6]|uniref:hypothetical protein n=1 Tax=Pseudooceanicola sp. C21-150M6 TaxID=3434355 RepID=UPI003D7F8470